MTRAEGRNENEDVSKNDCETKAFKRLAFPDPA